MVEAMVVVTPKESEQLTAQGRDLVATANALQVVDVAGFEFGAAVAKRLRGALAAARAVLDPFVQAADRAHKTAVQHRSDVLGPYLSAQKIVDGKLEAWDREQRRLAAEAAEAARREQARLEAEAQATAEAEQRRLREAAETRRLEEAAALEAAGDREAADHLIEEPVEVPVVVAMPVFAPPPAVAPPPRVSGLSFRDDWDFEVTDAAVIPREYLVPDEVKIRRVVKAMRGAIQIPGIKVVPKRVTAGRAR